MMDDEPRARSTAHEIGQPLDALSLHELDERLILLRAEIARLEVVRERKRGARDAAGSVFGPRP